MGDATRPRWVVPVTLAAFAGGVVVGGLVDDWFSATAEAPPFVWGEPSTEANAHFYGEPRPHTRRELRLTAPWTFNGSFNVTYVATLLVADDPAFERSIAARTHQFTATTTDREGVVQSTAVVRGGGTFYWSLAATPITQGVPVPAPLEGSVRFDESTVTRNR